MPIPLLLGAGMLAGGMLGSAYMNSKASKDASEIQQQAGQQGIDTQQAMFDKSLELQQPYREAGYDALGGLQNLADPTQRGQMLDDYYAGGEYQALAGQQNEQTLRNAAATGGIRGGNTQAALANIAPQLGQNFLNNQQNQLSGLANMGMGAASQGAQGAQQFGNQQSLLQQQIGQAGAQNALTQGGIAGNLMTGFGGMGYAASGGF